MHVCVIFGADEGIVVGNWSYLPMPKVIYKKSILLKFLRLKYHAEYALACLDLIIFIIGRECEYVICDYYFYIIQVL